VRDDLTRWLEADPERRAAYMNDATYHAQASMLSHMLDVVEDVLTAHEVPVTESTPVLRAIMDRMLSVDDAVARQIATNLAVQREMLRLPAPVELARVLRGPDHSDADPDEQLAVVRLHRRTKANWEPITDQATARLAVQMLTDGQREVHRHPNSPHGVWLVRLPDKVDHELLQDGYVELTHVGYRLIASTGMCPSE
jgi:hypothetical protein